MGEVFEPKNSSNIEQCEYDHQTKELKVKFHHGGTYTHKGVPHAVWLGMQTADSVGGYYHRQIKGRFDYEREQN